MTSPPTSPWAASSVSIAASTSLALLGAVLERHEVALVAHHAADLEALRAGEVGEAAGVGGIAAAAGEPDVDVDRRTHRRPASGGGGDRRLAVDGDGDPGLVGERGEGLEAARIDDLVGDEQVVAEPGGGHADGLAGVAHVNVGVPDAQPGGRRATCTCGP